MANRDYPVGAAQAKVLKALGLSAGGFTDAERIFAEIGIQVVSKRGVPQVSRLASEIGGFNADGEGDVIDAKYRKVDLSPLAQWM